jgi:hypothetical protein
LKRPRYSVQVHSFKKDDSYFEVGATDASQTLILSDRFYDVSFVRLGEYQSQEHLSRLFREAKGRVCVCSSADTDRVNQVLTIVSGGCAVALFTVVKPTEKASLPVFTISASDASRLWVLSSPSVKLKLVDSPATHASPKCYTSLDTDFVAHSTKLHRDGKGGKSYADVAKDKSKGPGFFQRILTAFVGAKEQIFMSIEGTGLQSNNRAFDETMQKIQIELRDNASGSTVANLLSDAETFLSKEPNLFGHVVAACHLCLEASEVASEVDRKSLVLAVFNRIGEPDVRKEVALLRNQQRGRTKHPHLIMYSFLLDHCQELRTFFETSGSAGQLSINVLVILDACGLFRKMLNLKVWRALRASGLSKDLAGKRDLLASVMDAQRARTAYLCLQPDLGRFAAEARSLSLNREGTHQTVTVEESIAFPVLQSIIEEELNGNQAPGPLLAIWTSCLDILKSIASSSGRRSASGPRIDFVRVRLRSFNYDTQRSLAPLSEAFSVATGHPDYEKIASAVCSIVRSDLATERVDLSGISELLSLSLGDRMFRGSISALYEFVEKAMTRWTSMADKLQLLDLIHQKAIGDEWTLDVLNFQRSLNRSIDLAVKYEGLVHAALEKTLLLSSTRLTLFSTFKKRDETCRAIVRRVVNDECALEIVRNPTTLRSIRSNSSGVAPFFDLLLEQLHRQIAQLCATTDSAARFYLAVMYENRLSMSPLRSIAVSVFATVFNKWKPSSMLQIKIEDGRLLCALYSKVNFDANDSDKQKMCECQAYVNHLVDQCLSLVDGEKVSFRELRHLQGILGSGVWSTYESFHHTMLPTDSSIQLKLQEMEAIVKELQCSVHVLVDEKQVALCSVFREYNCVPERGATFESYYETAQLFGNQGRWAEKSMNNLKRMLQEVQFFATVYTRTFYFCAYFVVHPSVLIREILSQNGDKPHSLESLDNAVESSRERLSTIFGAESRYGGVVEAMKILLLVSSSERQVEIDTLVKCRDLQITASDVDIFHMVALLYELSVPLQSVVRFFEPFKFDVALDDSFVELQHKVKSFYENTTESRCADCLESFRRIYCLLCSKKEMRDIANSVRDLNKLQPLLNLLSTLERQPELWMYVGEMEWFGEEGLKRFYEEYGNVTNVLLGESVSYEMSLLDSLVPVVRLISTLGKFRSSKNMRTFFKRCQANDDVAASLSSSTLDNIRQVYDKLSEIKDWFKNGIDTIASSHALYCAACNNGTYSLSECDGDERHQLPGGSYSKLCLMLQFTIEDGNTSSMKGTELNQFIQQLSLVQNENSATASSMQKFVDQFQNLSQGCGNVLTMHALGYTRSPLSDFRCRSGGSFLNESAFLLRQSDSDMRSFKMWLSQVRERSKLSLLFWTEELLDLYNSLQGKPQDVSVQFALTNVCGRLEPLSRSRLARSAMLSLLKECVATFKGQATTCIESWLVQVSIFLNNVQEGMKLQANIELQQESASNIVLHTLRCCEADAPKAVLTVVQHIYKVPCPGF